MTQRYYNENPQVTYLLEKIEEQEKVIKTLKKGIEELEWLYDRRTDRQASLECQIVGFLSVPWYKKMFYKFKV